MIRYVGLDVHKRVVEACALDEAGQVVFRQRFELRRETLVAFAQTRLQPTDRVVLEATTNTWAVVRLLKPHVAEVVVSNPLQTKAIAQAKVKTDKVDALVLAQLLRCDFLPRVWEPDEATQELRRWTSRRAALVADRTTVKNRMHSVLAQRLLLPPVEELFGKAGRAWLEQVELDAEGRWLIDSDRRLLETIEREIAALDQLLAEKGYVDPRVRLLMTLPGVQVTVAQTLLAAWGDIGRFRDADHAASYLGLAPSTKQSAHHCYHGPITKAGNGHARWVLVQAAQHVRLHPGPLGVFFRRLAKKKNYNVAVVASARKLAVIAWHMLRQNEPYRYAQPQPTAAKLSRLRVRATGQRRPTGPKKGRAGPKLRAGVKTRTVKPLAQVYREEDVPDLKGLAPGETRMVTECGVDEYVDSLTHAQVLPRSCRGRDSLARNVPKAACPELGSGENR
jgi:transposase